MKTNSKRITPTSKMRFSFPEEFEKETEFQRMVILNKELKKVEYLNIKLLDENLILKVYIPHFAVIFGRNEIELNVSGYDSPVKVSTRQMFEKFRDGYFAGLKYFEENYKVSADVLYGPNYTLYERTLHRLYYHPEAGKFNGEWVDYQKMYPIVFNFEQLFTYGYYSGLISCVFELRKKHPVVFQNFEICNLKTMHNKETTQVHTDSTLAKIIPHLKPFSGYWQTEKIMLNSDFDILIQNVKHLHETNRLPIINRIIPNCPVSNQFIMKTFSLLTHALYGKKRNPIYYELIKKSFAQFKGTSIKAIEKNYTTYGLAYSQDVKTITYDQTEKTVEDEKTNTYDQTNKTVE